MSKLHLVFGGRVDINDVQLAILTLTLGVNVVITWYEQRRGIELGSELLVADGFGRRGGATAVRRGVALAGATAGGQTRTGLRGRGG